MVRQTSIGVVLLVASAGSSALSLGSIQGRAVIGRSLELRVPVQLAAGEASSALCATARVHYGDLLVPAKSVSVTVVDAKSSTGGEAASFVSVVSTSSVNEPFVVVDLSVGCSAPLARNYLLLADPATVVAGSAGQAVSVAPAVQGPSGRSDVVRPPPTKNASAGSTVTTLPTDASPKAVARSKKSTKSELDAIVKPSTAGGRLTLDPVELVATEGSLNPALRMSAATWPNLSEVEVSPELQAKRDAARALWMALNSTPEQAAAQSAQHNLSVAELVQLRGQLASAQADGQAARAQLQEEQDSRWTQPVVVGLLLALVAALAGLALLWSRGRRSSSAEPKGRTWWKREAAEVDPLAHPASMSAAKSGSKSGGTAAPIDIDVDTLFPPEAFRPSEPGVSGWTAGDRNRLHASSDFLPSTLMDGARSVATEELFDLQQQVEFFISLGQADQAVDVLVNHISDSHEPSPLAYLDLLKLYHELGRRDDYENLRQSFNAHFNGGAPEFDHYSHSRRGLERYEAALSRIQAQWPNRGVLQIIERAIFRHDPETPVEVFDLEAYRELLLLYGIAREVIGWNEEGGGPPLPVLGTSAPAIAPEDQIAPPGADLLPTEFPLTVPGGNAAATDASFLPPVMSELDIDLSSHFGMDSTLLGPLVSMVAESDDAGQIEMPDANPLMIDVPTEGTGLAEDGAASKSADSMATKKPDAASVDFDFSDLGEVESFTIKKSGSKE